MKIKVLFLCVHNSARSQIAEELLRKKVKDNFEISSAGFEPGVVNPYVVKVLQEEGIDISLKSTRNVFDLYNQGNFYNYIITVCDESNSQRCPIFPGFNKTIHWSFEDPSSFKGSEEEILIKTRMIKNQINNKLDEWIKEILQD